MGAVAKQKISISPDAFTQTLDDEMIILNMKTERYFGLDPVAMDMWQLLEKHQNAQNVVEEMLLSYDIDQATLSQDLDNLIEKLTQAGLLVKS